MTYFKSLFIATLILCIHAEVCAQSDFRKGFIITSNRDTVHGFINFRESLAIYESCEFKSSAEGTSVTYSPGQIVAYGFPGDKFFESRELKVNDETQTGFVEVLIRGSVSLYRFGAVFYVEGGTEVGRLYPLKNEQVEVEVKTPGDPYGGRIMVRNKNEHIGILSMLMTNCPEVRSEIQGITLAEKNLIKLVEHYDRCTGSEFIVFKAKKPWIKFRIGVGGGINFSSIHFTSSTPSTDFLLSEFESPMTATGGAFVDIFSPRVSERLSFHSGLQYLASNYYSYGEEETSTSTTQRNYVTIALSQLKVPLGVRYTFSEKRFTPFLNGGVSSNIQMNSSAIWTREVDFSNVVTTYTTEPFPLKGVQFGFWGGAGVTMPVSPRLKGFLELRYEYTDGVKPFEPSLFLRSRITNFQVSIGVVTR